MDLRELLAPIQHLGALYPGHAVARQHRDRWHLPLGSAEFSRVPVACDMHQAAGETREEPKQHFLRALVH